MAEVYSILWPSLKIQFDFMKENLIFRNVRIISKVIEMAVPNNPIYYDDPMMI